MNAPAPTPPTPAPAPQTGKPETRPDHLRRGLIVAGFVLLLIAGGVSTVMVIRSGQVTGKPMPPPAAATAAPDPRAMFDRSMDDEQAKREREARQPVPPLGPGRPVAAVPPTLSQDEQALMQELRKSMTVKTVPLPASAMQPAPPVPAVAPDTPTDAEDIERQVRDLQERLDQRRQGTGS